MLDAALSLSLLSLPACLAAAAISDFRRFIIPNWISLALVGGYLVAHIASGLGLASLGEHALIGLGAFVIGFALFAIGFWGGGDGKLFAATALWFDWPNVFVFSVFTLLLGGALALVGLSLYAARFQLWAFKIFRDVDFERLKTHAPYGVAIAAAALFAFDATDLFKAFAG